MIREGGTLFGCRMINHHVSHWLRYKYILSWLSLTEKLSWPAHDCQFNKAESVESRLIKSAWWLILTFISLLQTREGFNWNSFSEHLRCYFSSKANMLIISLVDCLVDDSSWNCIFKILKNITDENELLHYSRRRWNQTSSRRTLMIRKQSHEYEIDGMKKQQCFWRNNGLPPSHPRIYATIRFRFLSHWNSYSI